MHLFPEKFFAFLLLCSVCKLALQDVHVFFKIFCEKEISAGEIFALRNFFSWRSHIEISKALWDAQNC